MAVRYVPLYVPPDYQPGISVPKDEAGWCACCGHKGAECECSQERCRGCDAFAPLHCKNHCPEPTRGA